MSKGFADFAIGQTFSSPRRTVTEYQLDAFAGLTGDFYPLHTDEVFARETQFGRRIAHGPLVYALAIGLMFQSGVFEDAVIAFLGVEDLRHVGPCFIGDTIRVEATVESARPTSDGIRGVVRMRYDVVSVEDGRELLTGVLAFLMQGNRTGQTIGGRSEPATI